MPFYAVARGHVPGVYESWPDCQAQINGYKVPRYKKFDSKEEAQEFVKENALNNPVVDRRAKAGSASPEGKRKHDSSDSDSDDEPEVKRSKDDQNGAGKDDKGFTKDDEGYVTVFCDGTSMFNGKHGQAAGIGVYFGEDHESNLSEPISSGSPSTNTAELQSAKRALEAAKAAGILKVAVHTDNQYVINCMTSWVKNWKKKGWVKGDGEPVKNKEDLIDLDAACEDLAIKWVHVKNKDSEWNAEATKMSKAGAKEYRAPS